MDLIISGTNIVGVFLEETSDFYKAQEFHTNNIIYSHKSISNKISVPALPFDFSTAKYKYEDGFKIKEDYITKRKQELIRKLEKETREFIFTRPDGGPRYTLEKQTSFLNINLKCNAVLTNPNSTDEQKQTAQTIIDKLKKVDDWIKSIISYHYTINQTIEEADDPDTVTWSFETFNDTDPDIRLGTIFSLLNNI